MKHRSFILKSVIIMLLVFPALCLSQENSAGNLFPDIPGFTKTGGVVKYTPETLFEFINGASELYFAYDFIEVHVQMYENSEGMTITAEIYDQKNLSNSFGIYSQERPYECEFPSIGAQANYIENFLNFYQDRYYVKVSGYNLGLKDKELLTKTAEGISERLGSNTDLPRLLKIFPASGMVKNSEQYIRKDFLGYSFFTNAFSADYKDGDSELKLFVMEEKERASLEKTLNAYAESLSGSKDLLKEGIHEIDDPWQGKIYLASKGRYIVGLLDPDSGEIEPVILKKLLDKVK